MRHKTDGSFSNLKLIRSPVGDRGAVVRVSGCAVERLHGDRTDGQKEGRTGRMLAM